MAVRILFVVVDKESHINSFPLGIAYLAAAARKHGYTDLTVYCQDVYHYEDHEITEFLNNEHYDVLCMGIYGYQQYRRAKSLCKHINLSKYRPKIVLGAHGPTASPVHFIKETLADIVVMGEGERVFCNLLDVISGGGYLESVRGIAYRNGNEIKINPREELIDELDSISFPAWDLFPMNHYALDKQNAAKHTDRCFPVLSSRGCPNDCNFCYRMYSGYRLRSVESVVEEINKLKKDYRITYITFIDENLMATPDRAVKFSEKMIRLKPGLNWDCMGRLNVATPDVLEIMKNAGCKYINYGIESLDQRVLDLMKKGQSVEDAFRGVENTIAAGMYPGLNIIWGNLGDTESTLNKSTDFLVKYNTPIQVRTIKPVTPYPGTELFKEAQKRKLLKDANDFYVRYLNTDLMTVNFTDIPDDKFYKLLFEANKKIISEYNEMKTGLSIEGFRKCYFENDIGFRGVRHT
jgi:anaerobic magnesium-protoporphyrin IX monomethyl ester cyclase